jgi:hypothetical protein
MKQQQSTTNERQMAGTDRSGIEGRTLAADAGVPPPAIRQ